VDLLRQAGAEEARAIIFCVDGDGLGKERLQPVLNAFPNAAVLVRAFDRRHMMVLAGLDIAGAVRELFESAVVLGREALEVLGIGESDVERIETEYRRRDGMRLEAQIETGDLTVKREMMFNHERSFDLRRDDHDEHGDDRETGDGAR